MQHTLTAIRCVRHIFRCRQNIGNYPRTMAPGAHTPSTAHPPDIATPPTSTRHTSLLRTSSPSTTSGRDEEIKKKLMAQMREKERRGEGGKERAEAEAREAEQLRQIEPTAERVKRRERERNKERSEENELKATRASPQSLSLSARYSATGAARDIPTPAQTVPPGKRDGRWSHPSHSSSNIASSGTKPSDKSPIARDWSRRDSGCTASNGCLSNTDSSVSHNSLHLSTRSSRSVYGSPMSYWQRLAKSKMED